jgi:hypothetical protein
VLEYFIDLTTKHNHLAAIYTTDHEYWGHRENDVFFDLLGLQTGNWVEKEHILPLINLLEISETPFVMYSFWDYSTHQPRRYRKADVIYLKEILQEIII